jgi:hypothetical protein
MRTNIFLDKFLQMTVLILLMLTTAQCADGTALEAQTDESTSEEAPVTDDTGEAATDDTDVDETATDESITVDPVVDDEVVCTTVVTVFYADADADGFGDAVTTQEVSACEGMAAAPTGYVADATDCNDTDATINTSGVEILADGIDQNCNGSDKYLTQVVASHYDSDGVTLMSVDTITFASTQVVTTHVHDFLGDGISTRKDYTMTYTHDETLASASFIKTDGTGQCLLQNKTIKDDSDMLTLEASDNNCNGIYENQTAYVNTYDANSDLTQRDLTISEDVDDDGIVDVTTTATRTFAYTYWDVELTLVQTTTVLQDGVDFRYVEINESGLATLSQLNNSDPLSGSYTDAHTFTYDESGFLLSRTNDDLTTTETPDMTETFERDAYGVKTLSTQTDSTAAMMRTTVYSNSYSE